MAFGSPFSDINGDELFPRRRIGELDVCQRK